MVLGAEAAGATFLDLMNLGPPHYSVKSDKLYIEQLSAEFKLMTEVATRKLTELRIIQNERVNKNRVDRTFKINDIVFVLDRTYVEGNPRVLRTTLNPSPYVVIRPLFKSSLVMRIADRFMSLYSNEDLKLFQGNSPLFQALPPEVLRSLLYKFSDLMEHEFSTITKHDPLRVPQSVELFVPDVPKEQEKTDDDSIDLFWNTPDEELGAENRKNDQQGPMPPVNDDIPVGPSENKAKPVPLEEQEFQELPEDDDLDEDIEELLQQNGESRNTDANDNTPPMNEGNISSNDDTSDNEDEPGMRLRSGKLKLEPSYKTVRFRES
jgi:hypothetical protein